MKAGQTKKELLDKVRELTARLQETEAVLQAIRNGEVDGLLVATPEGERVFTLEGAELPYRIFVESMNEGAATLTHDGTILYANPAFARMLRLPQGKIIHTFMHRFIHPAEREIFASIFKKGTKGISQGEVLLRNNNPVQITLQPLPLYSGLPVICAVLADLTRQKKLKATVDSLNRSRAILNQAADAIIICDAQGIITQASRESQRYGETILLGKYFDEAVTITFSSQSPLPKQLFTIADVLHGRIFRKQEATLSVGEKTFYILLSAQPLREKDRKILGCVVTLTDITTRKRMEDALHQSEERLLMAANAMQLGMFDWNVLTGTTLWTEQHEVIFGYRPTTTTTTTTTLHTYSDFANRVHPDDLPGVEGKIRRAMDEHLPYEAEYRVIWPDGSIHWVAGSGRFHYDSAGKAVRMLGAVLEITKRKDVEEELQKQRTEIELIYHNAPVGLCVLDENLRYVRINERLAEINGIPASDHIGKSVRELMPHLADEVEPAMRRVFETGVPQLNIEISGETPAKSGILRNWLEHWLPINDESGRTTGLNVVVEEITERKQAEDALRESHERLKKVVAVENVGVMFWDLSTGCLVDANDTFLKVMGYSRADVEAHDLTWQKFTPPEYHEVSLAEIRKFQETGRVGPYEKEYFCKDGTRQWMLFAGSALGGNLCVEFCVDISDRKKAEAELERTRYQLAEGQRIAHLGSWEYIAATQTLIWSDEEKRIYGLDPAAQPPDYETMIRRHIHPDDAAELGRRFRETMANNAPYEIEHRIVRPDGTIRWTYNKAHPYFDECGNLLRYVGTTLDITESKQAEDELRQSREDLAHAQFVGQIGSWRLDVQRNELTWSEENHRIFGVPPGTPMTYELFLEIVHPDDRRYVDTKWKERLAGEPYDIEHRLLVDGRVKWVREKAYLEFDEAGGLKGGFGITQDITQRKQAEELLRQRTADLEQLSGKLEQRVQERTEQLMMLNQELQASQARLQQLSRDLLDAQEKERKKVAWELHDSIGSFLTAIKFRIENVLREAIAGKFEAITSLQSVVPLVQSAVMEVKRIQMNLRPSMLDDLGIVATTKWFCSQFEATCPNIRLEQRIKIKEDDLPDFLKTVIFRVYQEGLNNAARHSNTPVIKLYLWKRNKNVRLVIQDNGKGFDLSEIQCRPSSARGLGLDSMRERVELSGGSFSIKMHKGKGTTIRASWPLDKH